MTEDTSQSHPMQFLAELDSVTSVFIYKKQYKCIHETNLATAKYSFGM